MGVSNIFLHPLFPDELSLRAPDASDTVELPGSQPWRMRKGKAIIISKEEHNTTEGCLPRRLVEFLPKDTQNLGTETAGCKSAAKAQDRASRTR